jgi:hypothetical protein
LNLKKISVVQLLNTEPQPLIDPSRKLALLWSAKAGCTFATKWFFAQLNILDAALFYDPWVHNYRADVFYKSKTYQDALPNLIKENYVFIKFVRSPFSRAVSSYIHALRYEYENERLERFFGRKITDDNGFSFEEFVNYLMSLDIFHCNIHHMLQLHPIEHAGLITPNHIVRLEDSINTIKKLERQYNFREIPLEELKESDHNIQHISGTDFCGKIRYSKLDQKFYNYKNFYGADLIDKVVSIYEKDFEAYEYTKILDVSSL